MLNEWTNFLLLAMVLTWDLLGKEDTNRVYVCCFFFALQFAIELCSHKHTYQSHWYKFFLNIWQPQFCRRRIIFATNVIRWHCEWFWIDYVALLWETNERESKAKQRKPTPKLCSAIVANRTFARQIKVKWMKLNWTELNSTELKRIAKIKSTYSGQQNQWMEWNIMWYDCMRACFAMSKIPFQCRAWHSFAQSITCHMYGKKTRFDSKEYREWKRKKKQLKSKRRAKPKRSINRPTDMMGSMRT